MELGLLNKNFFPVTYVKIYKSVSKGLETICCLCFYSNAFVPSSQGCFQTRAWQQPAEGGAASSQSQKDQIIIIIIIIMVIILLIIIWSSTCHQ